jgi:AcrR family transcriptional regulator
MRKSKGDRSRNPQDSRRALIAAAAKLFNTVGYHGTDSNRIARAAGYAPGTFYAHFPDKLAIFKEVYKTWVDNELLAIAVAHDSGGGTRASRARLARTVIDYHRKWRTFRASLRALYVTDRSVRVMRLKQHARQITAATKILRSRGGAAPRRARVLSLLLLFEVWCDAVADGDAEILGVSESEVIDMLVESHDSLRASARVRRASGR